MKRLIVLLCALSISLNVFSDEYRTFTDKEGRKIEAKILSVDLAKKKVTLERKNRKKAMVSISIFSEVDQQFISDWKPEASNQKEIELKKATSKPLTKKEVKAIAKKYVDELNDSDWKVDSWAKRHVFRIDEALYEKKVKAKEYKADSFKINIMLYYELSDHKKEMNMYKDDPGYREFSGWVLLTTDGIVKYDPVINIHPIRIATTTLYFTAFENRHAMKADMHKFISTMESCGVPVFGLTASADLDDFREAAEQMSDWLLEHGVSYDKTEPYVYYPEDSIKRSVKATKEYL